MGAGCSVLRQRCICFPIFLLALFDSVFDSFYCFCMTGARHNFPAGNQYTQPPPPLMGQDFQGGAFPNPNWNIAGKPSNGRGRERGVGGQQDPRIKAKRGR